MKKLLLFVFILSGISVYASEITEDYLDMASNYCIYGQYNEAMNYLNKISEIEPSNLEVQNLKSILFRAEHPNTYNKNTTIIGQNNSHTSLAAAKVNLYQKNYQNAIEILNKYILLNKNSAIAYALRAEAYMNLNKLQEAHNDITKALQIEENIPYLLIEAKILYYSGKYEDAKIKFNQLAKNVQTSEVYKFLGMCEYAENNYVQALLNIDKAIILSDDDKSLNSTYNSIKQMLDKQ